MPKAYAPTRPHQRTNSRLLLFLFSYLALLLIFLRANSNLKKSSGILMLCSRPVTLNKVELNR